jgi:hypothetical protein
MANVLKFSRSINTPPPPSASAAAAEAQVSSPLAVRGIWVLTMLLWPFLRWVLGIDCIVQLLLSMYRWDTAPLHAILTFVLHFGALCALTYFAAFYKPKGI